MSTFQNDYCDSQRANPLVITLTWDRPSESLLELLSENLEGVNCDLKKMFGQYAFFMNGNMFCGVYQSDLFVRIAPDDQEELLIKHPELRKFEPRKGMAMKEYLTVPSKITGSKQDFKWLLKKSVAYAESLPPKLQKMK